MNLASGLQNDAIKASLAEMDRKLRELQQELEISPRTLQASEPGHSPEPRPAPVTALRPAVVPGVTAPVAAPGSPEAVVDDAHATARRILENAVTQLGAVKGQIGQLLQLRDFLAESVRALLADCEQGLTQIETGLPQGIRESAIPPRSTSPAFPSAAPAPTFVANSPVAPVVQAPAVPAFGPPRPLPVSPHAGRIRLVAGPFRDIAAVGELEQALARVPSVQRVVVLGFEQSSVVLELIVPEPVDLLPDLERSVPFHFELAHRDAQSISLRIVESVEDPAEPAPHPAPFQHR